MGGHEHMMSAQAGFAMVRKLCKGGCLKMQARVEGSMKCKKILLPSYVHGTLSHLHIQMGACGAHEWSWWNYLSDGRGRGRPCVVQGRGKRKHATIAI